MTTKVDTRLYSSKNFYLERRVRVPDAIARVRVHLVKVQFTRTLSASSQQTSIRVVVA